MRHFSPFTRPSSYMSPQFISERVVSSRTHTEVLFDEITTEKIRDILINKAQQIVGRRPQELLDKDEESQRKTVQRFARSLVTPLRNMPHFLYNRIDFESEPVGPQQSLFGTGYQHTFWTIITINTNEAMSPETLVEAINDKFEKEVMRLRSVIRHELAHRLDMERIHSDPVKRIQSRRFQRAVTSPPGSSDYYGKPTEILAHANHTLELMTQGHEQAWREVMANYILSDTSKNHRDTKEYIRLMSKLTKELNYPFTQRLMFRRTMLNLMKQMHIDVQGLEGKDPIEKRTILLRRGLSPERQKELPSVRLLNRG